MPTKQEVKRAYKNLKRTIEVLNNEKNISDERKEVLIDKLLDKMLEMQKYLFDYLDEEDFEI